MAKHFADDKLPGSLQKMKASLISGMHDDRVDHVIVEYSGSGDDGSIDDVQIDSKVVNRRNDLKFNFCDETTVRQAAKMFAYELIEQYWAGWENNEGGRGLIEIDARFEDGVIRWDHVQYIQSEQEYHAELQ